MLPQHTTLTRYGLVALALPVTPVTLFPPEPSSVHFAPRLSGGEVQVSHLKFIPVPPTTTHPTELCLPGRRAPGCSGTGIDGGRLADATVGPRAAADPPGRAA